MPTRRTTARRPARSRLRESARRLDYRLARLELDLRHLSLNLDAREATPGAILEDLIASRRARRSALTDALDRVRAGSYGRCAKCGGEVDPQRLRRLPFAKQCVGCAATDDADLHGHLASQHRSLTLLLAAVSRLSDFVLAEAPGDDVDLAGSDAVAELLSDLAEELAEHFALEETDSYLAELARIAPGLGGRIESLRKQHVELCALADELLRDARNAGTSVPSWERIAADLRELLSRMTRHEADERALTHLAVSK